MADLSLVAAVNFTNVTVPTSRMVVTSYSMVAPSTKEKRKKVKFPTLKL